MHQGEDQDQDQQPEDWLGAYEEDDIDELQQEPNLEEKLLSEKDLAEQHLFLTFQNSATAIAQLYKEGQQVVWLPFQNAALAVTNMYKECLSRLQYCVELGQQTGRYTRTRDIVAWARKRHRNIRRDDLLAFLSGKTAKSRSGETSKSRSGGPSGRPPRHSISTLRHSHSLASADGVAGDLGPFHHALALQDINGTMSNINLGYHSHNPGAQTMESFEDLNHFDEVLLPHDHRKRSTQSQDCVHDSPARKRSRLL